MKPEVKRYTAEVGGKTITFETGKLAAQAGGAVTIQLGESVVFSAATMGDEVHEEQDFFPLTVEYEERMYAGGRIPGSFFRREGRPAGDTILIGRLVDRPIRPLFSQDIRNEVQVILYSLSADFENQLDILAINAASASLAISDIPWDGPVGAVRVGLINGEYVINPTFQQMEDSDLDLRIAGTADAILMVEAGSNEVSNEAMVGAIEAGHRAIQPLIEAQLKMAAEVGKPKREVKRSCIPQATVDTVFEKYNQSMETLLDAPHDKHELADRLAELKADAVEFFAGEDSEKQSEYGNAFEEAYRKVIRSRILDRHLRPDGRALNEIRPIWCEVDVYPRAHGTGLFTRGETQVLTSATLGTPRDAQEIDSLSPVENKRYIHHYNFPPFCTGEVKRLGGQSRREIGHGALAERALVPVIPSEEDFPYTIRLVSEVMSSNGSSSMASVCGSTLALMDAGVPIKAPVTGIAMGLIKEGDDYVILSDIQGAEDHLGDMDFKVAGTEKGITALQMDIKIRGITTEIMRKALDQANEGRHFILGKILEVIPAPRKDLKPHVPRLITVQVPIDKIGAIIGPGGKNIRTLQEATNTKVDIDENGLVYISATNVGDSDAARDQILSMIETAIVGNIYTGKVVRVTDFGAFVEILPNTDGMVHISQLDSERVNKVEDIVNVGDEITVMVTGIDENGKIRLSRQAVLEGWTLDQAVAADSKKPSSGHRPGNSDRSRHNSDHKSGNRGDDDRRHSGGGSYKKQR
ncbi:MAG TPA: polyribonucleotide nucleotidyltransferase [Flexilinea sp.]|nr:polyribonucleotide nucleotidyltransferase [Flexilinea sp.]HOR56759.1 polyribonucleotide nucleotidyltransferase [Flexilinea sp.]HPL58310.1 polyribonucleotide nucleotidyltransferase [Flexilinea sp.]HQF80751.1 polyribonucleotide nucleotidyltransferase [Flexilinea sp.]HQG89107.1 polyribonucleotide nucleotidyltransferase [Flexilinea sp.]